MEPTTQAFCSTFVKPKWNKNAIVDGRLALHYNKTLNMQLTCGWTTESQVSPVDDAFLFGAFQNGGSGE